MRSLCVKISVTTELQFRNFLLQERFYAFLSPPPTKTLSTNTLPARGEATNAVRINILTITRTRSCIYPYVCQ